MTKLLKYKAGDLLIDTNEGLYSFKIFLITDVDPNNIEWPYEVYMFDRNKKDRMDDFIDNDVYIEFLGEQK